MHEDTENKALTVLPRERKREEKKVDINTPVSYVLNMNLNFPEWLQYCEEWNDNDLSGFFGKKEHLLVLGSSLTRSGHLRNSEIRLGLETLQINKKHLESGKRNADVEEKRERITDKDFFATTSVKGLEVELRRNEQDYGRSSIRVAEIRDSLYQLRLTPELGVYHRNQFLVDSLTILGIMYPEDIDTGSIYSAWREIHQAIKYGDDRAEFEVEINSPDEPIFGDIPDAVLLAIAVNPARINIHTEELENKKLKTITEKLDQMAALVENDVAELNETVTPEVEAAVSRAKEIAQDPELDELRQESLSKGVAEHYRRGISDRLNKKLEELVESKFDKKFIQQLKDELRAYLNLDLLYTQAGFEVLKQNRILRLSGRLPSTTKYVLTNGGLPSLPEKV